MCYTLSMSSTTTGTPTSVRDIDRDLWRQLRAAALMQGVTVGQLLNQIIREWLAVKRG